MTELGFMVITADCSQKCNWNRESRSNLTSFIQMCKVFLQNKCFNYQFVWIVFQGGLPLLKPEPQLFDPAEMGESIHFLCYCVFSVFSTTGSLIKNPEKPFPTQKNSLNPKLSRKKVPSWRVGFF